MFLFEHMDYTNQTAACKRGILSTIKPSTSQVVPSGSMFFVACNSEIIKYPVCENKKNTKNMVFGKDNLKLD